MFSIVGGRRVPFEHVYGARATGLHEMLMNLEIQLPVQFLVHENTLLVFRHACNLTVAVN